MTGHGAVVSTNACLCQLPLFATCSRCLFDGEYCVGGAASVSHFLMSSSVLECSCMLVRILSSLFQQSTHPKHFKSAHMLPCCLAFAVICPSCEEPPSRPLGLCIRRNVGRKERLRDCADVRLVHFRSRCRRCLASVVFTMFAPTCTGTDDASTDNPCPARTDRDLVAQATHRYLV